MDSTSPAVPCSLFSVPSNPHLADAEVAKKVNALQEKQAAWFEPFWGDYWLKKARAEAWAAFKKHVKTEAMWNMVRKAELQQRPEMMRRDPQHRPYGASWLNGLRWEDESDPVSPALFDRPDSQLPSDWVREN